MPAKFSAYPSANIIFNRSDRQSVTVDGNGTNTQTGDIASMIDKDSTTFFQSAYQLHQPPNNYIAARSAVIIDYGQVFWNCQVTYQADISGQGLNVPCQALVEYSTDGTNYTALETDNVSNNTKSYSASKVMPAVRYIRFRADPYLGGGNWADSVATVKIYTCLLLGA